MNLPTLTADGRQFSRIGDAFGAGIEIALTARCQFNSGPRSGLENSEGGRPERKHQQQSPGAREAPGNENCRCQQYSPELQQPECQPFAPFGWAYVDDALRSGHESGQLEGRAGRPGGMRFSARPFT